MKLTVSARAVLDAPRAQVWQVLTDLDGWSSWNPHAVRAAGTLAVGERLDVRLRTGSGRTMRFRPTVVEVTPGVSFAWQGSLGVRGLFDGRHLFCLDELPDGRTRIVQREDFSGLLVRPLRRAAVDAEASFADVHAALGRRLAAGSVDCGR